MAEYSQSQIRFGWLDYSEMIEAIENGDLNAYDICFTKDTKEEFIINSSLEPVSIKSRLRVYASTESAIEDIQSSTQSYEGEVISVRDDEKFIAYTVNKFANGDWYITPIYSDTQIDYNLIQNIPIKNIKGTISEPINMKELEDGHYLLKGNFITPIGTSTFSLIGDYVIVDTEVDKKKIKRIANDLIIDYVVNSDGTVSSDKYATEKYIESKGYATISEVETKLTAFKVYMEEYVEEYVDTTVSLLVKYLIDQELDSRYAQNSDIQNLFN